MISLPRSKLTAAHAASAAAMPRSTEKVKVKVMLNFLAMERTACAIAWSAIANAANFLPTVVAVNAPKKLPARAARLASLYLRDALLASLTPAQTSLLLLAAPLASHERAFILITEANNGDI